MMKFSLRHLVLLGLTVCSACSLHAAVPAATAWENLPAHPRLFADAARWDELRRQLATDPVTQQLYALIRLRAEGVLAAPPVAYVEQGAFLHGPMRQVQGRIATLALAYRLGGDARFLDRARAEMTALARLPDWCPRHFLDVGEAALGMALGLDWLHDTLPPEERTLFATALIEKALRPSLEEAVNKPWLRARNNWNPVCHGGLAIGALAVAERDPALARLIVERSLTQVGVAAEIYAPVGGYSEGPGYWAYGTTFYALLAEALRGVFGVTGDLEKAPGFLRTADYVKQMTAPSGDMYNFADSTPRFGFEPVMFWFARELGRGDLVDQALDSLNPLHDYLVDDRPRDDASRLLPLALVWWRPALAASRKGVARPLAWWSEGGAQPQAAMRSAWDDPRATFVGLKAGKVFDSHAHMDVGSFILEADGVRWAVDLGRDSYPLARANGIGGDLFNNAQASKRWTIFRAGPDSHNLLRFDGAPQDVNAKADLRPAHKPVPPEAGYVMDLTPVYRAQVENARRGLHLQADKSVIIQDEWKTAGRATRVTWQWLTRAEVAVEPRGARLTQSGETFRLRILSPENAAVKVEDVSKPLNAWDSPNPRLRRITISLETPAHTEGRLVVWATPATAAPETKPPALPAALAEW